jgi:hypothetical protein
MGNTLAPPSYAGDRDMQTALLPPALRCKSVTVTGTGTWLRTDALPRATPRQRQDGPVSPHSLGLRQGQGGWSVKLITHLHMLYP